MITTPLILFGIFCIILAVFNAKYIRIDMTIAHYGNAAAHIAAASWFALTYKHPELFLMVLCEARIVFTIPLNIFRGLPYDYVTDDPVAFTDKVEQWIFKKNGWAPVVMYVILFIICVAVFNRYEKLIL